MSSLSKGSSGIIEEIERSSRSNRWKSTRGEKIIRKFRRCIEFFLGERGPCSYDDESINDIKLPLRYKHLVKQWISKDLLLLNIDFRSTRGHIAFLHYHYMVWGYFLWIA